MIILRVIDRILYWIENTFLISSLVITILFSLVQIILRYFFNSGVLWIDPLTRYLVLCFCLFGASLGFRRDQFIGLEVITNFLSKKYLRISQILTYIVTIVVLIVLFQASIEFLPVLKEESDPMFFNVPKWYFAFLIPVGFGSIILRIILRIIYLIKGEEDTVKNG